MIMYILLYRSYVFLWFIVFHADLMILLQRTMVTALENDPSKAYDQDHPEVLDDHDGLDDPHERDHFRASKALKSSTPKAGISIIHIEKKNYSWLVYIQARFLDPVSDRKMIPSNLFINWI